jgi:hypothetical protein
MSRAVNDVKSAVPCLLSRKLLNKKNGVRLSHSPVDSGSKNTKPIIDHSTRSHLPLEVTGREESSRLMSGTAVLPRRSLGVLQFPSKHNYL